METKWLVMDTTKVGNLYFGRNAIIARGIYTSWAAAGHAVGVYAINGAERKVILETASFKRWRIDGRPIAPLAVTDAICFRCQHEIPVSSTVPAVNLDGLPVCGECERMGKAQDRATWLKDAVRA